MTIIQSLNSKLFHFVFFENYYLKFVISGLSSLGETIPLGIIPTFVKFF